MAELKSFPLDYYRNYLDVDDCSPIYNHCNGKQFEAATKLDLCEFLNLRTPLCLSESLMAKSRGCAIS